MSELRGEIAVVIGAGSVIGHAACRRLAAEGAAVIGVDTAFADRGDASVSDYREVEIQSYSEQALGSCLARIAAETGGIRLAHFVCDMAAPSTSILATEVEAFDAFVARDLEALFVTMRSVLPGMVDRQSGSLLVSCSVAGLNGRQGAVLRTGGDHSLIGLVRAAAMDVAAHGVTVNAICHPADPATAEAFADGVADAAIFLSSSLACSITGHHFVVDGAESAGSIMPVPQGVHA